MKKSELKAVLNRFGYQFLEQINNDISKILFEIKRDPRKRTNMTLDTFINTLDDELESRDAKNIE